MAYWLLVNLNFGKKILLFKHNKLILQLLNTNFLDQFKKGVLDPNLFDHEAHLRLAWLSIDKFGLEQAEQNIQEQLQNFVEIVGAKDKYHKTLTIASTKMVNNFMQKSKSTNFEDFIIEFPQLKSEFKRLVGSHYSFNIFNSNEARETFIQPDKLTFE